MKSLQSTSIFYLFILVFLIASSDVLFFFKTQQYLFAIVDLLTCSVIFLLPLFFFRNHLKFYAWLLLPVMVLVPLNALAIILFNVPINDATVLLVLNTNYQEASELMKGYITEIIIITVVYFGLYYLLIRKLPNQISSKSAASFSIFAICIMMLLPFASSSTISYISRLKGTFYFVFPTSIIRAVGTVYKQNQLISATKNEKK